MRRVLLWVGCLVLLSVSCRLTQINPFKRVVDHPRPEMKVDNSYFKGLGCFESVDCLPEEVRDGPYSIEGIYPVPDLFGALKPELPVAIASSVRFYGDEEVPAVYSKKCMATFYYRYLILGDDQIQLVDSVNEMREIYAPIENEDEALAYAVALTGYSALFDLANKPNYKVIAKPLEATYSRFDGEVFKVHLFNDFLCGCGPHITKSVDVTVMQDGSIHVAEPADAFQDVTLDGLCID